MEAIRPIPKRLLNHTVNRHKVAEKDRMGKVILDTGITIKHVRIEPSSKVIRDKSGAEIQLAATMFYDCRNSEPRNVQFAVDDIINFSGQCFSVQAVEPLYDNNRLHHYELGMIRHA